MRDKPTPRLRFRLARGLAIGGLLSAALVASVAGASYGRATVGTFHSETPSSETITNFPCFEGHTGDDDRHRHLGRTLHRG